MKLFKVLFILFGLFAACSQNGTQIDQFGERKVNVDGTEYPYRVLVPARRDPNMKLPVMLYLHGSGSRGHENREQAWAFAAATDSVRDKMDFIVVLPQCRENTFWSSVEMSRYALAALDQSIDEFNGDRQRLHLAGFSLGAAGTWQIAATNPGRFAALIPAAGVVGSEWPIDPQDRQAMIPDVLKMLDAPDPYKTVANAIGQTPTWVFHGAKDESVPVEFARKMVKAVRASGNNNVKYTKYPDDGHLIVTKAFQEPGFFEWLAAQSLEKPAA